MALSSDCIPWLTDGLTDEWRFENILEALLTKQGLWPEPVAYNCLLNWVFLTGKRCCLLPFWVFMGGRDGKGVTETWWYHRHINQK